MPEWAYNYSKITAPKQLTNNKEIENIINKNIYPTDKQDLKAENDKGSAMDVLGLKPKIIH